MITLLVVEDDAAIREMLGHFLRSENYNVLQAENGLAALGLLSSSKIDLILLDWMLPDLSGPQLIKRMHRDQDIKSIPIIMLTALAEEENKIKGLETGADDYMTKPVSLQELKARIRALLRRTQGMDESGFIKSGVLAMDPANHELWVDGKQVSISPTEFRLLHYFMSRPGRLQTRAQLLDHVWGQSVYISERTVDVHVLRLRKFLKSHGADQMIKTVRGAGYKFMEALDE